MSIFGSAKSELQWWISNIDSSDMKIDKGRPQMRLDSDASGQGWGATDGETHIRWHMES